MVEIIKGEVVETGDNFLVLFTGGIGFKVWTTPAIANSTEIGEVSQLFTDLILRETDVSLYGIQEISTRDLFRTLIKINGIGPKAALSILSTLSIQDVSQAVKQKNVQQFVRVPGIGNKSAQKIILYLQDAMGSVFEGMEFGDADNFDSELQAALVGLGYSVAEVQACIQSLPHDNGADNLEDRLRMALQYFSG